MRRRTKRYLPMLAVVLSLFFSVSVFASTDLLHIQTGSIEIKLTDGGKGTSKSKVTFGYTKVADMIDGGYVLVEGYEKSEINLNELQYSDELDEAAKKLTEYGAPQGTVDTDSEGKAVIENLPLGIYLLEVTDRKQYENVSPVLIAVPTWSEDEGTMLYDVTVIPKHTPNAEVNDSTGIATGDFRNAVTYMMIMTVCVAIILVVFIYKYGNDKAGKP